MRLNLPADIVTRPEPDDDPANDSFVSCVCNLVSRLTFLLTVPGYALVTSLLQNDETRSDAMASEFTEPGEFKPNQPTLVRDKHSIFFSMVSCPWRSVPREPCQSHPKTNPWQNTVT